MNNATITSAQEVRAQILRQHELLTILVRVWVGEGAPINHDVMRAFAVIAKDFSQTVLMALHELDGTTPKS